MPNYRRRVVGGGTYFFTVVTEGRQPILGTPAARRLLHDAIDDCRREYPFDVVAIVLLLNHLHAIWTLPEGDGDYAGRWARIKAQFTRAWLAGGGSEQPRSDSRLRHRRRGVWQRKYWEHHVRDAADYERHMHYVHWNPVKHGLAACPHAWPYSTFGKWVQRSVYEPTWCCACDGRVVEPPSFDGMPLDEME